MRSLAAVIALGALTVVSATVAGPLTPPAGPVAPTPGPEPRTPISMATTPGDADSIFKITQAGSYYLTGNITGVSAKRGIEISAPGVTLDLMGFDLAGVPGSLEGIHALGGGVGKVTIVNGTVRSWGLAGINLTSGGAEGARVVGVIASANGSSGIAVASGSLVSGCVSVGNAGSGIQAAFSCVVTGCTAQDNGSHGVNASSGAAISDCAAFNNTLSGFSAASGSTVARCVSRGNAADGIVVSTGSSVLDCTCSFSTGDGIQAASDCLIRGNTCNNNGVGDGAGVHVSGADNRIEANLCTSADRGVDADIAGNLIVRNTCGDNTVNYDLAAGNRHGPIVDLTTGTTPAVAGNAAASTLTSTDANANYAH